MASPGAPNASRPSDAGCELSGMGLVREAPGPGSSGLRESGVGGKMSKVCPALIDFPGIVGIAGERSCDLKILWVETHVEPCPSVMGLPGNLEAESEIVVCDVTPIAPS